MAEYQRLGNYLEYWGPEEIHIRGHRIWIEDIVNSYNSGHTTVDQLLEEYPTLTREEIAGTLADYFAHKDMLDALTARNNAWVAEREQWAAAHPSEHERKMHKLWEQWQKTGQIPVREPHNFQPAR